MLRVAIDDVELAAGHGSGSNEGAGFDAVGDNRMLGAAQTLDTFNAHLAATRALDARAHLVEQFGQVNDFGLARRIDQRRFAVGERRRHHQVLGAGDCHLVEINLAALQSFGAGDDIAAFERHDGTELFKARQVEVNRALTDGAAARQRYPRFAEARQQWPERQHRRAHGLDQIVRRFEQLDLVGGDFQRPQLRHQDVRAEVFEQTPHGDDVAHVRQVVQCHGFGGQQGRRHAGQCRVLCAADGNAARQRPPANDSESIHPLAPSLKAVY